MSEAEVGDSLLGHFIGCRDQLDPLRETRLLIAAGFLVHSHICTGTHHHLGFPTVDSRNDKFS